MSKTDQTRRSRRAGRLSTAVTVIGCGLVVGGVAIGGLGLVAPATVERLYGEARQSITELQTSITGELPRVRLGASGGIPELDRCDGTFTEMKSYEGTGRVPPVWAAHNACGGDVTLPWQIGQLVTIDDSGDTYEVVEVRDTAKRWVTTEALLDLKGDLALQTCYYGEERMKFVGLTLVTTTVGEATPT